MGLNRTAPVRSPARSLDFPVVRVRRPNLLSIRRVYRQGLVFSIFKFFVGGFVYLSCVHRLSRHLPRHAEMVVTNRRRTTPPSARTAAPVDRSG